MLTRKQSRRCLSGLAVMDFRFLAPLGMTVGGLGVTGRRGRIIAAIPFYLPLSAHDGRGDLSPST